MKRFFLNQCIILLLCLAVTPQLLAQERVSTRWYLLKAPHVNIIFRGNIDREAQRIANTFEQLYEPVAKSMGVYPPPITLIIRNQRAHCNAHVQLGPRKMELNSFSTQNYNFVGTNEWLSFLLVHEMRHVAQYAKLYQRFNKLLYWLGGDMALASISHINVPAWFLEGDAVGIETALTLSGRGRIPNFSCLYKTNLLAKGGFSYYTQILGSFKDKLPNDIDYVLGYYLTTYLRKNYGATALADILEKTTWPLLFHSAVKRVTGKSLLQIYEDTNQELKTLWEEQLKGLQITPAERLNARDSSAYAAYIDYTHPQLDESGKIIVLKSSMDDVTQLVLLDDLKKERKIVVTGDITNSSGFSVAKGQIIWTQEIASPIWKNRSYHVIKRYDIQRKKLHTLTHKNRYSAAALSPDATQIIALESDESYNHQLVILDATNGKILHRFPNPDNDYYLTPSWSEDGKHIVTVKQRQQKVTIACIDVATGIEKDLLPYSEKPIGLPIKWKQYVFYNSPYSGIDNIYAVDLTSQQQYQVTSRAYGAYNPVISADGRWIFFNDFTKDGMDVVKMPLEPQQWTPLESVEDRSINYFAPLLTQEDNCNVLSNIPNHSYPVEPYSTWKHLLNIHSWPLLEGLKLDPMSENVGTKSAIHSNSILEEISLSAGYRHDFSRRTGDIFAEVSYEGFYPVISLSGNLIKHYQGGERDRQCLGLGLNCPWQWTGNGQYNYQVFGGTESVLKHQKQDSITLFSQAYKGNFRRRAPKVLRDFYPPWGQDFNLEYLHTPFSNQCNSHLLSANATLYLPGIMQHQSLRFIAGCIRRVEKGIFYRYIPLIPPGALGSTNYRYNLETHYCFPICYPDWDLGWLFYVKRLSADIAYAFTYITNLPNNKRPHDNLLTLELLVDMNLLCHRPFGAVLSIQNVYDIYTNRFRYRWPRFSFTMNLFT